MFPGLLVKLRPTTPWRIAPDSGARDRVDSVYHSDTLYSAVSHAMERLGQLDDWLAATAGAETPAVSFTSCFPFLDDTLLIMPPRNLWPPPPSTRVRWKAARFVPLSVVETLLQSPEGRVREDDGWVLDAESECLLRTPKTGRAKGPFRIALRNSAAIDRYSGTAMDALATACLEFVPGAGLWFAAAFADQSAKERWKGPVTAAVRLLADSGFGGERSRGWGRSAEPEIREGELPEMLIKLPSKAANNPPEPVAPIAAAEPIEGEAPVETPAAVEAPAPVEAPVPSETAYWLLSVFSPKETDAVDWNRGAYAVMQRSGRVESVSQHGAMKRSLRMLVEGSVVMAQGAPKGTARDVAPEGSPHPVYRAGFAFSIPITWRVVA